MKTLLAQVVLIVFYYSIIVKTETSDVDLCKRQPFRGRCPSVKGRGLTRSQFVLRYYLRDNECVSYPFGHCADDENEPMLYRYKEDCEKACMNKLHNDGTTNANDNLAGKSESFLDNKIADSNTDEQVGTTSESFSENDAKTSTRPVFTTQKTTPHKLLTECERQRQGIESGLIVSDFIPICTADGSFRPLQCESKGERCFCVDRNGGKVPNSYSNGTKKPDCKRIMKARKQPSKHDCSSPLDSGPCTAAITRWYYDDKEKQCIQFEYSGCGGNGNNYPTKLACEKQCRPTVSEAKCKDGLEPLKNDDGQLVNCNESSCPDGYSCSIVQFGSICCPINTTIDVTPDVCQLPKERGPCDRYELRFYYNSRLGECKYFFFGGCEGNANNFERVEECERICRRHGVKVVPALVSAPQLITSGPQMRKLTKEYETKSIKKISEMSELVESTNTDASATGENNTSSISDAMANIDDSTINSEIVLKTKQIDANLSANISHDNQTGSKDLFAISTDQNKSHLSQKINQNIQKKIIQKETKTQLSADSTVKLTDSTTIEPENTSATLDSNDSIDESNRSGQKLSSKSIVTAGQQLSSSEEQITTSPATLETAMTDHADIRNHGKEKLSDSLRSSSISTPPTTPVNLLPNSTTNPPSTISTTTETLTTQPVKKIDERCFHSLDRGTCTGQFVRWHWDTARNTCQVFTYSGCGGNGNNFRSREDCFAACHRPVVPKSIPNMGNVCEHSIHPGDCTGVFQRFAFDSTIGDCRPFTYTGCGGNGNNFGSPLECRNKCVKQKPVLPTDVCQHPVEVGECSGVFPRFAYDLAANECRPFTYGGCGGNGNNFGSMAECKAKCVRGKSPECPTVDISLCVEPCILFSNRHGCPECTCPMVQSVAENDLAEPTTPSAKISDTSFDESQAIEDEQLMLPVLENNVEKKHASMSHSGKTFQTNSVTELGEKCTQPMDAGPCKNFIERWFFDISSGLCQSFQYGGCAGNRNHFFSEHECEIHCARFFNGRTGRRRTAYQNASRTQHNTLKWSQSTETLNEHEHEDITQQSIVLDSSNDVNNQIINASKPDIISAQQGDNRWTDNRLVSLDEMNTDTETDHKGDLIDQQKQSRIVIQKINNSQARQKNELLQEKSSTKKFLGHDTQLFQHENIEDITSLTSNIFDSQIAKQMLTDLATVQNSQTSNDEQLIKLPQAEISESQRTSMMANDGKNQLKTGIEKTATKKTLTSNSASDNLMHHNQKISIDRNGGRLISKEISMGSTSPGFGSKNAMQLNSIDELYEKHKQLTDKVTNHMLLGEANSQSVNNHLSHSARVAHLQHAIGGKIALPSAEEFSHDSMTMHTNTRNHEDQTDIETELPMKLSNFGSITDNIKDNNNADISQEKSSPSSTVFPIGWNTDSDDYRIIDKMDDFTLEITPNHESLTSTIIPKTTESSTTRPSESVMEKTVSPIASASNIFSTSDAVSTVIPQATSINHSILSSVTIIPTGINIMSTPETIAKLDLSSAQRAGSTVTENKIEGSLEPSIPNSPQILSQPVPSGNLWLLNGLQSIVNSQSPTEQHSQQAELSEKKLSFDSFDTVDELAPATFSTTDKTTIFAVKSSMLTDNQANSAAGMNTTVRGVKLQTIKRIGQLKKSKEFEETRHFNVDSLTLKNAHNSQNKNCTVILINRNGNDNINMTELERNLKALKEMQNVRGEEIAGIMNLSSKNGTSIHDFINMPVNNAILKPLNVDILHQFASTISEPPAKEVPFSAAQPNSQPDVNLNQDGRLNIVEDHSLHSSKHQQLQQSVNLNEITEEQFTAAHNTQVAQSTSSWTTPKQDENEEMLRDRSTMNQAKMTESEISNQQDIFDLQETTETTPQAVLFAVTSLQQLKLEQDDTCVLPPDAGSCRDYVPRWFYNSQTGKCEQFSYGSCNGNSNNFLDRHSCEAKCSQGDFVKSRFPERCTYKKDEGHSNGYYVKWYFNVRNLRCEQMVYQGEGGNSNQFETLNECQTFCTPLNENVHGRDKTTKQIEHSPMTTSTAPLQQNFAPSREHENQKQQMASVTEAGKVSESEHHAHTSSQNTPEAHHQRAISDTTSIDDKNAQRIISEQHSMSFNTSTESTLPFSPVQEISHILDVTKNETSTAQESSESLQLTNIMNESGTHVAEKKIKGAKIFTEKIKSKDNDAITDLSNILEDVGHAPSCPNGLKPIQHADGRPMMCLPGRNQCSGNSLCYFNGIDFFCCPNAEDPYDEHIFGGYGGEEVKRGYKNVKKTPINANELIVRKLRLKRQAQVSSSSPLTINKAARIDFKVSKNSLASASFPTVDSDDDVDKVNDSCMHDLDKGTCSEAHLRFFYDHKVGFCRLFYYTGCGGNENNFVTEEECRQKCKDKIYSENAPPGSCPYGEPPFGDNAPVICGKDAGSFECPNGYYCRMGPPNVCCLEKHLPALEKISVTRESQKNIRFSPEHPGGNPSGYQGNKYQKEREVNSALVVPKDICPDGSNALLDEDTGQPLKCGSGYDGSFCPIGYYCSINSENNERLCCELGVLGVKIPPLPTIPPYFGLRRSNPGEIILRGSLPSDDVPEKESGIISDVAEPSERHRSGFALFGTKLATDVRPASDSHASEEEENSSENLSQSESRFRDEVYGRMMLKSNAQTLRSQAFILAKLAMFVALYNALGNVASPEAETNEIQIDVGEMKDPFESMEYAKKTASDRSICFLKPNEGRTCREDESPPRTNLQYFYSTRDKRCKLYFYRGCGGSQNRFDTKRHCEMTCGSV
uniref:Papilin n=1 Tax=Onchocerca volvulus TaxID=6282 RepID=A0A8R1TYS2_ONCVO